jgi:hypothetical protein
MNPSSHDILLAFYYAFLVIPSIAFIVSGLAEFFETVKAPKRLPLPPPTPPLSIPTSETPKREPFFYERRKEYTWCGFCRKRTEQELSRTDPAAFFQRICTRCNSNPNQFYDQVQ